MKSVMQARRKLVLVVTFFLPRQKREKLLGLAVDCLQDFHHMYSLEIAIKTLKISINRMHTGFYSDPVLDATLYLSNDPSSSPIELSHVTLHCNKNR